MYLSFEKKNNYDYCFPLCNSSLPHYFDLTSKECINLNLKTTGEHSFHFNSKLFANEEEIESLSMRHGVEEMPPDYYGQKDETETEEVEEESDELSI